MDNSVSVSQNGIVTDDNLACEIIVNYNPACGIIVSNLRLTKNVTIFRVGASIDRIYKEHSMKLKRKYLVLLLMVPVILISGCASASITPAPPTAVSPTDALPIPTDPMYLLYWHGKVDTGAGNGTTVCKQFQIDATVGQVALGDCNQLLKAAQPIGIALQQAKDFEKMLGSFELATDSDQLSFHGEGSETNSVWQRAMVQWVRLNEAEMEAGHVCASCPTVFNWFLDAPTTESSLCRQVYVTSFGQVAAQKIKCHPQGDTPQTEKDGWLTTTELTSLDEWLYSRGQYQEGDNYFNGLGTQAVTENDQTVMKAWAEKVYARMMP
jgi:hypothetical protein